MTDDKGATEKPATIVDDHALFRRGLEMVLQDEDDLMLVGEASDGEEAVEKAQELMPDVVLMDVRMPKRSDRGRGSHQGPAPAREDPDAHDLRRRGRPLRRDQGRRRRLPPEGDPDEEVADAIRSVWAGQSRISPSMASKLLTEFAAISKEADERPQMPAPKLTDREMEVLRLVAQGLNNRDIAKQLFISENTVKNHIRNILEKLHLHSRMEAVVYAVREKMIEIT